MKLFDKGELKLLWPFYLEYFIASFLYFMPAFIIVYFASIGLSPLQMGILIAVWPLTSLLFEIPTGAIADLYGRKISVLIGYFLEGLVMISLFFWKTYPLMLVSFAVLGIAATFSSGSKDAWIVDLINKNNKKLVHNFFNKMQFFINFGLVFSGFLGAFLVKSYGVSIIWIITALSYLFSIILLAIFAKEYYEKKNTRISQSLKKLKEKTKESLKYSRKHHVLYYLIFAIMVSAFAMNLQTNISWTPMLKSLGMPDYVFGYMWSGMSLIIALSPLLALKLLKKGGEKKFIILGTILMIITLLCILFAFNLSTALIIMYLGLFFYFSKSPAQEVYFHRFIPSRLRATIGSIRNMFFSIGTILALPLAGFLVEKIGPRFTIFISAILMIPVIILYLKIKENKHEPRNT